MEPDCETKKCYTPCGALNNLKSHSHYTHKTFSGTNSIFLDSHDITDKAIFCKTSH